MTEIVATVKYTLHMDKALELAKEFDELYPEQHIMEAYNAATPETIVDGMMRDLLKDCDVEIDEGTLTITLESIDVR